MPPENNIISALNRAFRLSGTFPWFIVMEIEAFLLSFSVLFFPAVP